MEKSKVKLSLTFNNKDGQSHNSTKIINAEKQKVPCEIRPHHRILSTGSKDKTNLGN